MVFDAPARLVGRLVDVEILEAGPWSLVGIVADGLADAVPLDSLEYSGEPTILHDITLPPPKPQAATSLPAQD